VVEMTGYDTITSLDNQTVNIQLLIYCYWSLK